MNWAKHAAEAIVDDERELQATEDSRRRKKLLVTLLALSGVAGLGALAYNKREGIGDFLNKSFGDKGTSAADWAKNIALRGTGAAALIAAPRKAVTNRLPWGGGIPALQRDITGVQTGAKDLSPSAEALAAFHKNDPKAIDKLNTMLSDPKHVAKLLDAGRQAHNAANPGSPMAPPLNTLPWWEQTKANLKGLIQGTGITQAQREGHQLPAALEHLAQAPTRSPLLAATAEKLGLPAAPTRAQHVAEQVKQRAAMLAEKATLPQIAASRAALKAQQEAATGAAAAGHRKVISDLALALRARERAPSSYQRAKGWTGTPARAIAGAFLPEVLSGLGSVFRMGSG